MREWKIVSVAADTNVYFCDPQAPWQRATNESTNGLLRQYFQGQTSPSTAPPTSRTMPSLTPTRTRTSSSFGSRHGDRRLRRSRPPYASVQTTCTSYAIGCWRDTAGRSAYRSSSPPTAPVTRFKLGAIRQGRLLHRAAGTRSEILRAAMTMSVDVERSASCVNECSGPAIETPPHTLPPRSTTPAATEVRPFWKVLDTA